MSAPKPSATGNLDKTPLAQLLVYALDRHLDGTLVIESPDGVKDAVLFQEGAPAKAQVRQSVPRVGEILVANETLTREQAEGVAAESVAAGRLFGELCIERRLLEDRVLLQALREQVTARVISLFKLPHESVYGYYAGTDFLVGFGGAPTRVKPLPLLWLGLRERFDGSRAAAVLSRLQGQVLKLHIEAPIGRFKLTRDERTIVDLLRGKPQTLQQLANSGVGSRMLVERVVYALALTRQFDFGVPGVEPIGVEEVPSSSRILVPHGTPPPARAKPEPAPPVEKTSEVVAFEQELASFKEKLSGSLYDLLGIPETATADQVQQAFLSLAKRWHPDRLPSQFAHLAGQVTGIFSKMSEAQQILSDPARREEYDAKGAGAEEVSAEEQEQVALVLRAATAFQRAEVLLKKRNLQAAEDEARAAMEGDPEQAEYMALYAWVKSQRGQPELSPLIAILDRALKLQPNSVKTLYYRGQLYKRAGKPGRALADFRAVLELNPNHLDAQREVRLHEMRRGDPKPEKPSLLGKWFKK